MGAYEGGIIDKQKNLNVEKNGKGIYGYSLVSRMLVQYAKGLWFKSQHHIKPGMVVYAWQAMARVQKFKGIFGYVRNSRSGKDRGEKEGWEWEWERFSWVYSLSVR